jgi:radical SAM superfamily enzyme YgiQ (UPF0313 family)
MPGYVAAVLQREGLLPKFIDAPSMGWSLAQTLEELSCSMAPDLCLLTTQVVYSFENTELIFRFLQQLKELNPRLHINLFGYYPTFAYDLILAEYPFIDSITLGEPEITIAELGSALREKQDWRRVPGIAYRTSTGGIIKGAYRPPVAELDSLPFPWRTGRENGSTFIYIQGSRGCYNRCLFCYINPFYGHHSKWRGRSPENIVQEMTTLLEVSEGKPFYFADPNFFGPGVLGQLRAIKLARLIKDRIHGIIFGFETRANDIQEGSIALLTEAGLRYIFLGIESGSQHWLDKMQKNITVADNIRALKICRKYGLEISTGFIMFAPFSTLRDIKENLAFLKDQGLLHTPTTTSHVLYHPTFILRGHPLYSLINTQEEPKYFLGFDTLEPTVQLLYQYQAKISQKILAYCRGRDLEKDRLKPQELKLLDKLNRLVIEGFSEALSLAERIIELDRLKESLSELQMSYLNNIEKLLSPPKS